MAAEKDILLIFFSIRKFACMMQLEKAIWQTVLSKELALTAKMKILCIMKLVLFSILSHNTVFRNFVVALAQPENKTRIDHWINFLPGHPRKHHVLTIHVYAQKLEFHNNQSVKPAFLKPSQ